MTAAASLARRLTGTDSVTEPPGGGGGRQHTTRRLGPCHGGRDSFELKWHAIGVIIQWLAAVHSQAAASPDYSEAVTWLCFTRDLNFNG